MSAPHLHTRSAASAVSRYVVITHCSQTLVSATSFHAPFWLHHFGLQHAHTNRHAHTYPECTVTNTFWRDLTNLSFNDGMKIHVSYSSAVQQWHFHSIHIQILLDNSDKPITQCPIYRNPEIQSIKYSHVKHTRAQNNLAELGRFRIMIVRIIEMYVYRTKCCNANKAYTGTK